MRENHGRSHVRIDGCGETIANADRTGADQDHFIAELVRRYLGGEHVRKRIDRKRFPGVIPIKNRPKTAERIGGNLTISQPDGAVGGDQIIGFKVERCSSRAQGKRWKQRTVIVYNQRFVSQGAVMSVSDLIQVPDANGLGGQAFDG